MNKKKLSIIITVIVAVVAVVAVIGGISINKHNEQKREAQRQEEESKSKARAKELEQAKNDLLAYISDDTYVVIKDKELARKYCKDVYRIVKDKVFQSILKPIQPKNK